MGRISYHACSSLQKRTFSTLDLVAVIRIIQLTQDRDGRQSRRKTLDFFFRKANKIRWGLDNGWLWARMERDESVQGLSNAILAIEVSYHFLPF
jgi:hypothetical protein